MNSVTTLVNWLTEHKAEMPHLVLSFFLTKVLPVILVLVAIIFFSVTVYAWQNWNKNFGGQRVSRRQKASPSNAQPPQIVSFEESKGQIIAAAQDLQQDDEELVQELQTRTRRKTVKDAATIAARKKATRIQTMTAEGVSKMKVELTNRGTRKTITSSGGMNSGSLSAENASGLDMDHVYLSFFQLLWGYLFVGLNADFLMRRNTFLLKVRVWLNKIGLVKPKPTDYDAFAAKMCLETSMACYYKSKVGNTAGFFFPDMPYVDGDGKKKICSLMIVHVDVMTKKMTKATFDGEEISSRNVAGILFFYNLSANHVKIHSMANWGLNSEESVKEINPFLYRSSIVTIMYNHFGFTGFAGYIPQWVKSGFLCKDWTEEAWIETVTQGVEDNIFAHPNIEELVPYSRLVNFIVKARPVFLSDFAKYREQFPGVHGEAFFIGTVLHSLDHTCQDWACEDPLWLDVDDERFGLMAQMGRVVKVGFIKDLPLLYFHKRFKGASHPFYSGFYAKAAKIDKKYADVMDTCIVK